MSRTILEQANLLWPGEGGRTHVLGFGGTRFEINGVMVDGPQLLLPDAAYHWCVNSLQDCSTESLALVTMYKPAIRHLLIGTGATMEQLPARDLVDYCGFHGIVLEAMATEHAVAQFNQMNMEGRNVAAALLPLEAVEDESLLVREHEHHQQIEQAKKRSDDSTCLV
jgi:uncharacterized protein